jgi:hypothetical protein
MTTFKNPPIHFGTRLANQTLDWLPTDTKENYEKLIQDPGNRAYFARLGWDQPGVITYKFNNYGYRADEFDSGPYMVALGCSYSIGIGLPDSATWARQTATALGMKCANLSWGGYSADSCYRLAEYWVPALKPDYVCMLVPPRNRIEVLLDDHGPFNVNRQLPVEVFLPQSQSSLFSPNDHYLRHWFLNGKNAEINQRKNILAVRQLCADLNIPCTVHYAEEHMCWNHQAGHARDYMHAGPQVHKILADKFVTAYTT